MTDADGKSNAANADGTTAADADAAGQDAQSDGYAEPPDPAVAAWLGTRQFGTTDNDDANAVVPAANGEIYVIGTSATPGADATGSRWTVTRLSRTGTVRWRLVGPQGAALRGVLGPDDSVLVAGEGGVSRVNANGVEAWHILSTLKAGDIAMAPNGSVLVGGLSKTPFAADPTLRPPIGTLGGQYDGWVMRVAADSGKILDQLQIGNSQNDWVNALTVGSDGSVYVTGPTEGTFPGATHWGQAGEGNCYVLKLKPDLTLDWAIQPNGGMDQGYAIRLNPKNGQVAVMLGHGGILMRFDPQTGAKLGEVYVGHVAGIDLAIDAAGRTWFAGSVATGNPVGFVTLIDVDDKILGTHWFVDSPSLGISYTGDFWGTVTSHVWGVSVDSAGYAWVAGDTAGDMEQNTAVSTLQQPADPSLDGFVARLTPDFVRDGLRFVFDAPKATLAVGASQTLQLTVKDGDGKPVTVPAGGIHWTSELPGVATVDATGKVTAVAAGRSHIIAHVGRAASEPVVVIVTDAAHPDLGRTLLFGTDHGDVPTLVMSDPQAGADQAAVIVAGWTNGPLANPGVVPDYDAMHGGRDLFFARVAGDGSVSGVRQMGGSGWDAVEHLAFDAKGNAYMVGKVTDPLPEDYPHHNIVSLDPAGNARWSIEPGFQSVDTQWVVADIGISNTGELLALGTFDKYAILVTLDPATGAELSRWTNPWNAAPAELTSTNFGFAPDGRMVLTGQHDNGQFAWLMGLDPSKTAPSGGPLVTFFQNCMGGPYTGVLTPLRAFAVAPTGSAAGDFVVATATATGLADDGSGPYRGKDGRVLRFGPDSKRKWLSAFAPPGSSGTQVNVAAVAVDKDGSVYAVGSVDGGIGFKAVDQGTYYDAWITKLNGTDGTILWGHMLQSNRNDYGTALTITPDGTITAVGYTFGNLDNSAARGRHDKEAADVFVARFAPDGSRR